MSSDADERPGPIDRALRVFGDVRAGEGGTVLLMCLNVYLLLMAYYILKTVREPLILLAGGAELKSYAAAAQALTLIYFAVGSAVVSAEGQRDLAKLVETAKALEGYLIEVEGFADASGNAAVNQKLSLERSQAVVNWRAQQGGIPFVRMLAPGAMSTAQPAASNETAEGRAQNRRVVAKVLVNKGIAQPSRRLEVATVRRSRRITK